MIQIGKKYVRTAPNGDKATFTVKSEQEVVYHQGFIKDGYIYSEVK
jgi:hypothetical protein